MNCHLYLLIKNRGKRVKKKLFEILSTLFVISILAFIFIHISPGEPAENYLRASRLPITETLLQQKREELGLNKPLIIQYLIWLKNVFKADFGYSFLRKEPAMTLVINSLYTTFQLSIFSSFLIIIFALPFGIISAIKRGGLIDKLIQGLSFIFVSIPVFWLGFSLILLFSVKLRWLPVSGRGGFLNFILPSITLSLPFIGQYTGIVRKSIIDSLEEHFLENAILRGLKAKYIIYNYYLKASWVPILTAFSLSYIYILTGSILVEEIFAWPGIGTLFIKALQAGDVPLIQACIIVFALLFISINYFMGYLLKYLDPRLRRGEIDEKEY